jgi:16S rRNA A1518/A1519 N6-dimethyltransferase RsmA/KsgA/DIM1 with predicted DNA glycosylase/AP lyase activity
VSTFIRLTRHDRIGDRSPTPELLFKVVRAGFGQRRKRLSAALRTLLKPGMREDPALAPFLLRRAQDMSLEDFTVLTNLIFDNQIPR